MLKRPQGNIEVLVKRLVAYTHCMICHKYKHRVVIPALLFRHLHKAPQGVSGIIKSIEKPEEVMVIVRVVVPLRALNERRRTSGSAESKNKIWFVNRLFRFTFTSDGVESLQEGRIVSVIPCTRMR